MNTNASYEAIWRMEGGPLRDESPVRELLQSIFFVLGDTPRYYDLNQRGQWREFESEDRLVVDLLTQRTQIVALSDRQAMSPEKLAVISTGKRESSPQVIARCREEKERQEAWRSDAFWLRALGELSGLAFFSLKPVDVEEEEREGTDGQLRVWWIDDSGRRSEASRILGPPVLASEGRLFMKTGKAGKVAADEFNRPPNS